MEKTKEEKLNNVTEMVIYGRNDTFKKDYTFKELSLKIHLSIKMPNNREKARIRATVSDLFSGTEQSYYTNRIYTMLVMINEFGKDTSVFEIDDNGEETKEVKDYFSIDGYAREDLVYALADDVEVWMSRFRG